MKKLLFLIMASSILLGLNRSVWAIEPGFAQNNLPIIVSIIKGQASIDVLNPAKISEDRIGVMAAASGAKIVEMDSFRPSNAVEDGSIGIINIDGVITKGDWCYVGTNDWTAQLDIIEKNQNFLGTIFVIDSPGGDFYGVQTLTTRISQCKKPVFAYIKDGICGSGACWIAASCDEIYFSHETCQIGSIGVFCEIPDWKGFYEANDLKLHTVYSNLSPEKNLVYTKVLENDYDPIRKEMLDPMAETFINAVKSGRGDRITSEEGFLGKMYMAKDAKRIGLIDGVKSFDQVVSRISAKSNSVKIV